MDTNSIEKLSHVHPELAKRVTILINNLAALGYEFRVVQGLRTAAEQDALYAQGRTKPGAKVTNARAWQSNHNFGLACDLTLFVDGKPDWNNEAAYKVLDNEVVKVGLESGGFWKTLTDRPHAQLAGLDVATCRKLYEKGGLQAVWLKMNEILLNANKPASAKPVIVTPTTELYTVQAGDTLYGIAKRFNVYSADVLKEINGLKTDTIKVGQTLKVH